MQIILITVVWQQQGSNKDRGQFVMKAVYNCCFRLAGMGGSWASGAWKHTCQSSRSQHMSQKTDGTGILLQSCRDCCHTSCCARHTTEYHLSLSVFADVYVHCRLYSMCLLEGQHQKLNPSHCVEKFAVFKIPLLVQNSTEAQLYQMNSGCWSMEHVWSVGHVPVGWPFLTSCIL